MTSEITYNANLFHCSFGQYVFTSGYFSHKKYFLKFSASSLKKKYQASAIVFWTGLWPPVHSKCVLSEVVIFNIG
jgi:hypothetical protein